MHDMDFDGRLPQSHRQGRSGSSAWVCRVGSCCSSGSVLSGHGSGKGHNPVERGVDWVFRVTGLQKVAHKLHDDERVTWAILALIVGATFSHVAAGDAMLRPFILAVVVLHVKTMTLP